MAHYIDKDALLKGIDVLKKNLSASPIVVIEDVIALVESFEVKEVDLEGKATQLSQKYFPDEENIWARSNIEAYKCKSACIEMVEWLKAQK